MEEHIVIKEGEQYPSEFNDTRMIGEEVNISYMVTSSAVFVPDVTLDINKTKANLHLPLRPISSGGEVR